MGWGGVRWDGVGWDGMGGWVGGWVGVDRHPPKQKKTCARHGDRVRSTPFVPSKSTPTRYVSYLSVTSPSNVFPLGYLQRLQRTGNNTTRATHTVAQNNKTVWTHYLSSRRDIIEVHRTVMLLG